ncbi:MAG: hypothetical protein J5I47_12635 [Vicingus serpentipes]|nr:hypothetical protein [Vicingus serpentipes]
MRTIKHHILTVVFIATLLSYYWHEALTPNSEKSQFLLAGISLLLLIASLILRKSLTAKINWIDPFLSITTISAIFILIFYFWNGIFNWYSQNNSYTGNIFRGAFIGFRAPFYGHLDNGSIWEHKQIIITSAIFLFFAFVWRKKWQNLKYTSILIGLIGLLILSFSWHLSLEQTFLSANCHYSTFASDLSKFESIQDILSQYTQKVGSLGVHNNHYPPGNLLLLKIEENYWPYLSKLLTFIATLFALFPLYKLMKLWNFSKSERLMAFIFYGSSGAILFFPGIAMSPLMLPFSITATYLMMKAFQKRSFIYSMAFTFVIAGYTFFTYSALIYLLFCAVVLVFKVILKEITIKQVVEFGFISFLSFIAIYFFIYLTAHFNMWECFVSSVSNEKVQMDYSGIDNWSRYFIVSTGNILAYIGIIGIPTIGIIFHGFSRQNTTIPKHLKSLTYALVTTIILISFSNQFYLEVERIWIFLTPFYFVICGWLVAQFYKEEKYSLVFSLILITVVTSASLSISINHCY